MSDGPTSYAELVIDKSMNKKRATHNILLSVFLTMQIIIYFFVARLLTSTKKPTDHILSELSALSYERRKNDDVWFQEEPACERRDCTGVDCVWSENESWKRRWFLAAVLDTSPGKRTDAPSNSRTLPGT